MDAKMGKGKKRKGGKWRAGIKTKGGEDGVCDGDDAPFFRDAATYRRAWAALKGFTCAELLCRIASRVMVSKEDDRIFFSVAPRKDARSFGILRERLKETETYCRLQSEMIFKRITEEYANMNSW